MDELLPSPRNSESAEYAADQVSAGDQIRPWVRYWARMVDYLWFSLLVEIVLALIQAPAIDQLAGVYSLMALFVYVFVESAMLAGWGTTPGKALLRVHLRGSDGSKLSYKEALGRSLTVWFKGEGAGIPVLALLTNIHAYQRLVTRGVTSWDRDGGFKVVHQAIGAWRTIAVVMINVAILCLMIWGSDQ